MVFAQAHDKLEPRFYCESGVERRIHEIFVGDFGKYLWEIAYLSTPLF